MNFSQVASAMGTPARRRPLVEHRRPFPATRAVSLQGNFAHTTRVVWIEGPLQPAIRLAVLSQTRRTPGGSILLKMSRREQLVPRAGGQKTSSALAASIAIAASTMSGVNLEIVISQQRIAFRVFGTKT